MKLENPGKNCESVKGKRKTRQNIRKTWVSREINMSSRVLLTINTGARN
jgi:hypothetical protein